MMPLASTERNDWPWSAESPRPALADPPRISVITPSYNQGRYLEATIHSVLAQEYPNLEYILIDGGSTDDSVAIIRRYAKELAGWTSAHDDGPAQAINHGFAQATGDILAWLNADDLYAPGALWAAAAAFAAHPEAALVYGEGWYIDAAGAPIEPCRFVRRRFDRRYLVNRDPILQPAAFWRRALWTTTGPLDESLRWVFDWEWFIRAHAHGPFLYLPRDMARYRVQPAALTRTGGLPLQLEHGRVTRRYGGWWHPNHVVQQMRRLDDAGRRATARLPGWLARPLQLPLALPRAAPEVLLRDMYMR